MQEERLGPYELRGTLGHGAFSTVYDAWDPRIMRRVAIKTLHLAPADDEDAAEALARFRREAQAAGGLQHPGIVSVHDFGQTDRLAYIVMEFMDGGTLKDLLAHSGALSPARAVAIMAPVLAALAYSHARGVVHRDVKPANIMLDQAGHVKLGDFGVARIETSGMTLAGDVLGTPSYMAPEQHLGETADARSDLYAAGATLFHLLTGRKPYEGARPVVRQLVLAADHAPNAHDLSPSVPPSLSAAVQRAMARQPADRFADCRAFMRAIEAAVGGAEAAESANNALAAWRRGATRLQTVAALATVCLVSGGIILATVRTQPAPPVSHQLTAPIVAARPKPAATQAAAAAAALDRALAKIDCALVHSNAAPPDGVTVTGIGGGDGAAYALRLAATAVAATGIAQMHVTWAVRLFEGPFCPALDAIRPAWRAGVLRMGLRDPHGRILADQSAVLHRDMLLQPVISGLDFAAFLRVDDLQQDGTVVHIYPRTPDRQVSGHRIRTIPGDPSVPLPAANTLVLGQQPRPVFQVEPPFGTDLLIAVASAELLPLGERPNVESARPYLDALRAALDSEAARGRRLAAAAAPLETSER